MSFARPKNVFDFLKQFLLHRVRRLAQRVPPVVLYRLRHVLFTDGLEIETALPALRLVAMRVRRSLQRVDQPKLKARKKQQQWQKKESACSDEHDQTGYPLHHADIGCGVIAKTGFESGILWCLLQNPNGDTCHGDKNTWLTVL